MKRALIVMASALCASAIFAGGVENKTNLTTGYARNPSRNVENSRPEAAFYNIAGTAFLNDGFYAEIGDQVVIKKYTNDWDGIAAAGIPGGDTSDTTPVFLYPDVDIVYKRNNLSIFGTFGIYAGGGSLNYDDGTSLTTAAFASKAAGYKETATKAATAAAQLASAGQTAKAQAMQTAAKQAGGAAQALLGAALDHELKIKSITYGGQIGAAFKPIDMLSVAAAVRFTYGTQSMKLKAASLAALGSNKVEYEASAFAVAPVLGVHLRPIEILDVSLQWQGCSYMNYNIDKVKGNTAIAEGLGVKEDKKFRTDIPMALNLGVGVRVLEPLYLNAGFTYYMNNAANTKMNNALGKSDYDDSFEISVGADYTINKQWGVGAGVCYGNQGQAKDANSVFSPVLDSVTVGCGVEYKPIDPLTITLAGMYSFYFDEDYELSAGGPEATLSKKLGIISLGATYKFF